MGLLAITSVDCGMLLVDKVYLCGWRVGLCLLLLAVVFVAG